MLIKEFRQEVFSDYQLYEIGPQLDLGGLLYNFCLVLSLI